MKKYYYFSSVLLFLVSCNTGSSTNLDKEKLELEKEKLDLAKKQWEIDKEKGNNSEKDNPNGESDTYKKKPATKTIYVTKPSESEQENVIQSFYEDFDNAYDRSSMNSYISRYYSGNLQSKYYKSELPSFNAYQSKYHNIQSISMIGESNESRSYRVEFYFEYTKSNGRSASVLCADILTLDNNNKIIARNEIGKIG